MTDRRDLAGDVRACLAPGERMVWNSVAATVKIWQTGLYLTLTVAAVVLIPSIWLNPFGAFDTPHRGFWISVILIGLTILMFRASLRVHAAVVLTETNLYFRGEFPGRGVRTISRADITEATVFDGDNVVVLHAANGDRTRLGTIRYARQFVYALNVPARAWVVHEGPKAGRIVSFVLFGLAVTLLQWVLYEIAAWKDLRWSALPIVLVAAMGAFFLAHGYRAWRMNADERRRAACKLLDPRWRGCEPIHSGQMPMWRIPIATIEFWLVKMFYGMPSDCSAGHGPQIIA